MIKVKVELLKLHCRDETFKRSLSKLREDISRANGLVREANFFAEEMGRLERFSVTLQIPPQNLSPNRKVNLTEALSKGGGTVAQWSKVLSYKERK